MSVSTAPSSPESLSCGSTSSSAIPSSVTPPSPLSRASSLVTEDVLDTPVVTIAPPPPLVSVNSAPSTVNIGSRVLALSDAANLDPAFASIDAKTAEALEIEAKYAVYLDRQAADAAQIRREEERLIPETLDFSGIAGLSNELRQKMQARKPRSIAEAQRMEGMTPAALALILAHVRNVEARRAGAA